MGMLVCPEDLILLRDGVISVCIGFISWSFYSLLAFNIEYFKQLKTRHGYLRYCILILFPLPCLYNIRF